MGMDKKLGVDSPKPGIFSNTTSCEVMIDVCKEQLSTLGGVTSVARDSLEDHIRRSLEVRPPSFEIHKGRLWLAVHYRSTIGSQNARGRPKKQVFSPTHQLADSSMSRP